MTSLIDGKAYAAHMRRDIADRVERFRSQTGKVPGLAVVLVGEDAASAVYVKNKGIATREVGMNSFEYRLPATVTEEELLAQIEALNLDEDVHGILVQLPLPAHLKEESVIAAISPDKDADGFHVVNAGRLAVGQPLVVPCTPLGCIKLIKSVRSDLSGLHAVVVGRSNIVGKPVAQLLIAENCTVTIAHSRTQNLPEICRQADILVVAVGRPEMITQEHIKQGAIVIDVGINRLESGRIVGDVQTESASLHATAITPVPGGVGPMTIACLLENTLTLAQRAQKS